MSAIPAHLELHAHRPAVRWLFVGVAAVVFAAFFCIEHDVHRSLQEEYGTTADVLESAAAGSRWNQAGFAMFAGAGLVCLVLPSRRRIDFGSGIAAAVLLFVAWCALSVFWSLEPALSVRRLGILIFCLIGGLGLVRQFTPRELCWMTMLLLLTYAMIGVAAEAAFGTFRPWESGYRFVGTVHPNAQGGNCAFLCLASALLLFSEKRHRLPLIAIFLVGLVMLLLTKSRTSCVALIFALGAVFAIRARFRARLVVAVSLAVGACAVALIALMLQFPLGERLAGAVLLGRSQNIDNLNGRTELWEELARYAAVRPWHGYGYRAFWTAENISTISEDQFWGMSSAHSGYLEMILSVGLIGLGLLAVAGAITFLRLLRACRWSADVGVSFLLAVFVYSIVDGVMESGFAIPSFMSVIGVCAFLYVGFVQGGLLAANRPARVFPLG